MYKISLMSILAMLFFISCNNTVKTDGKKEEYSALKNYHAKGFEIIEENDGFLLRVMNPWKIEDSISFEYTLQKNPTNKGAIPLPIKKAVVLSTTHIAYIDLLNETSVIKGLANPNFVSNTKVISAFKNEQIKDVGSDRALNYEMVLSIKPDVIFTYGITADAINTYARFKDWNIPVVYIGEYLENSPLGKVEWLRFFSCFFDKLPQADSIYKNIAQQYDSIKQIANTKQNKPVIMTGMPWKGVWHVPGNESFMAQFIKDAGGEYLWNSIPGNGSAALAMEQIFADAKKADLWLVNSMAGSLEDVLKVDPRLKTLAPYQKKNVYNNNKQTNAFGGNAYWESGVVNPHLILSDFLNIFHSSHSTDSLNYYLKLNAE